MGDDEASGPDDDDRIFAANMARLRTTFGISQAELVTRLQELGWKSVYQTTISRIEKGERPVRIGEARAIARALGVDLAQMTMARRHGRIARSLAEARESLTKAEELIERGTRDWLTARRHLELRIQQARDEGFEPGPIPEQPEEDILGGKTPVTVEDELAEAIAATQRNPRIAVEMGEIRDELEQARITGKSLS